MIAQEWKEDIENREWGLITWKTTELGNSLRRNAKYKTYRFDYFSPLGDHIDSRVSFSLKGISEIT